MSAEQLTVAVVGAGGKMGGMRVSRNLQKSTHNVFYSENSPAGQERVRAEGRDITATDDAVPTADVVILAVPDTVLGIVSEAVVPQMKSGAILLTLDPAAAYAACWPSATTSFRPWRTPPATRPCSWSAPPRKNGPTPSAARAPPRKTSYPRSTTTRPQQPAT